MRITRTIPEMREALQGRVGLVPTMGAFHEGHLNLMREARRDCNTLVCSLFVNPTQFGPSEDYTRYPRNEQQDAEMAESVGVDILFAPTAEEMYAGNSTTVSVAGVSDLWEGAFRPTHFSGVATIVCKLFNIVAPHIALFGLKDLQQCAVIKRMVANLNMPVQLKFCPTTREADGLAMSSRNAYLSAEDRSKAPAIYRELTRCSALLKGCDGAEQTDSILDSGKSALQNIGLDVDYFALVDTDKMTSEVQPSVNSSIITAARIGKTRLIDNIQLG